MDSRKLQALQQANSHLAPIPQRKTPTFQHGDYRPSRSPVFQNYPQYKTYSSNFAHINMTSNPLDQQTTLVVKPPYPQPQHLSYHDQIHQSSNVEKIHHTLRPAQLPGVHQHVHSTNARLQQQFQALEQEKIQQQLRTQNEALSQQQQTFALRQQLNPPVPNSSLSGSQVSSMSNMASIANVPLQLQQQMLRNNNRNLPPSSLNITNQYQPGEGPMSMSNMLANHQQQQQKILALQNERLQVQHHQAQLAQHQHQIYQQHFQMQEQNLQHQNQTPTDVPMIQQNIPSQVVNQAVQTQISGSGMKTKSPETSTTSPSAPTTPSTPTHGSSERKKSEQVHALKSPTAKRHPNAPVSLSGWLWKQGSEGLKVWRKRWFVLSEYCLFYYKGPEEEKIMGSVLLPSYKISVCTMDDKPNRKYAFKCEHANMRTYVLAAENLEAMNQWVKGLMMASLMQGSSESESQPSISSFYPSGVSAGDNSDSGVHTYHSQPSRSNVSENPMASSMDSNSAQQYQPLYANAPPKPRRVTDCGYSSPSPPENAVDQYGQLKMRQDQIYGYKTAATKNPEAMLNMGMQQMRIEQTKSFLTSPPENYPYPNQKIPSEHEYMQRLMLHQQMQQKAFLENNLPMSQNYFEASQVRDKRPTSDYEDIYQLSKTGRGFQNQPPPNETGSYQRPLSPVKYDGSMQIPPMPQRYTPNFLEQQQQQGKQQNVNMRAKPVNPVARPHSADFLEYEARNPVTTMMKAEPSQAPRPKSSLDINRSPHDNSYYSESSYAEKMRQSALYLQTQAYKLPAKNQDYFQNDFHPPMNSQTLQREIETVRANRYEISDDIQGSASVPRVSRQNMNNLKNQNLSQQESFLRSASARLPKKEEDPSRMNGERKREESMKRLLEWKQRMLQSPLTRKGPQPPMAQMGEAKAKTLQSPLTVQGGNHQDKQKSNYALQRSRSESHTGLTYDAESSDDDGRSSALENAYKTNNETHPHKKNIDTGSATQSLTPLTNDIDCPQTQNEGDENIGEFGGSPYIPVYKNHFVIPHKYPLASLETPSTSYENDSKGKNVLESEPTTDDNAGCVSVEEKKPNDNDMEGEEEELFEYTDDDLDEALAENDGEKDEQESFSQEKLSFDVKTEEVAFESQKKMESLFDVSEGHYLPMAPKKSILSSSASETSILAMDILNSVGEENPYIEMSSGTLEADSDKQSSPYELVFVPNRKDNSEPLYMELSQGAKEKTQKPTSGDGKGTLKKRNIDKSVIKNKKRHDLPDILKQSHQGLIESDDSSDADDEDTSKEPTNLKSRTRFSLSDTFRPASYYLGASTSSSFRKQNLAECIDSSDSEIAAPPPIPVLPPPFDNENSFACENFNTIKRNSTTSNEIVHHRTLSTSSNCTLGDRLKEVDRTSRLSLQDQLLKQQLREGVSTSSGYLNLPQLEKLKNSKLFSTASSCSINTDDGSNTSSDFDLYNKIKLQSPSISADSLNQSDISLNDSASSSQPVAASKSSRFKFDDEQHNNENLDKYLDKLETSSLLYSKEQTSWLTQSLRQMSDVGLDQVSLHYENIHMNEQKRKLKTYYDSLEDVSVQKPAQDISVHPLKEKNLSFHDAIQRQSMEATQTGSNTLLNMIQPSHSRNDSNLSDSAPYYYSDLGAEQAQTLNNQRDIRAAKKNSKNISHIQNPISITNKQQLTSILKDQAKKDQGIDSRNIYESGSGRVEKLVNKDESLSSKHYSPDKNTNVEVSMSIDNLLYSAPPQFADNNSSNTSTVECDQLWEEDAIWRESLRRVSQRHARSLDDLDRIESISSKATRSARISDADQQSGISPSSSNERKSRSRISRDVTYVNETHQRTLPVMKKKKISFDSKVDEVDGDDVYVQLAPSACVEMYETLRDDGTNIDRENIRQWDLMSSGLVKTSSASPHVAKSLAIGQPTTMDTEIDPNSRDNFMKLSNCCSKPSCGHQMNQLQ